MPVIYKYPINIVSKQTLLLPGFVGWSSLLHFDFQGNNLCLWALSDPSKETAPIEISIFGTGHEIDDSDLSKKTHFDTVLDPRGFVWHIFVSFDSE